MEMNLLNALSDGDKARYMRVSALFNSDGWKDFVELYEEKASILERRAIDADTWEQVLVSRGLRLAYLEVSNLETSTENEFTQLAQELVVTDFVDDEELYE